MLNIFLTLFKFPILFCFQNSTVGHPVITLIAVDDDVGDNSKVDLMFVIDDVALPDYRYFIITNVGPNKFVIRQNTTFDREAKASQYKVWLPTEVKTFLFGSLYLNFFSLLIVLKFDRIHLAKDRSV